MYYSLSKEKALIKKLGQMIIDFASAKTTDEACLSYFQNIQNIMNFSAEFTDKIKEIFPHKDSFLESFNDIEQKLLNLIPEEKTIKKNIAEQLSLIGYMFDSYIPNNKTLLLTIRGYEDEQIVNGEPDVRVTYDGPIPFRIDEIKDEIEGTLKPDTIDKINQLMSIGNEIEKLTVNMPTKKIKELYKASDIFVMIEILHRLVGKLQRKCRAVLEEVITGKFLHEIQMFIYFLQEYNLNPRHRLMIADENFLIETPPIREDSYLEMNNTAPWYQILKKGLVYFMVEYFRLENSGKYLRRCTKCENFFVSNKMDKRIKFCSNCSPKSKMSKKERREYQKTYRQKKKKEALAIQGEARIKNLVNQGWTREEAEEIVEADSMM